MATSIEFRVPQNNPIRANLQAKKKPPQKTRSKGQLEHRSSAILPFSAWVEPHRGQTHRSSHGARDEELRLKKLIQEKEERLKEFQQVVKTRVRNIEQMKREEQHGMSVEAFEVERNVVRQSSIPSTVRRDNCVYRDESELKIQRSVTRDFTAVDSASQLLDEHAKKIRNCSKHARKVLSSKSLGVEVEQYSKLLPGGLWRTSPTKDHGLSRKPVSHSEAQIRSGDSLKEIGDYWIGENAIQDQSLDQDHFIPESGLPRSGDQLSLEKHVHFENEENSEVENEDWDSQLKKNDDASAKRKDKYVEMLLQPAKLLEENKARAKSQVAVYRRLFMDIEREQVRENIRMREHRKRMETLKVEKEVERLEIEQRQIDNLKMQRVRKEEESFLKAQKAKKRELDLVKRHKKLQKERETERYIEALQAVLRDKAQSKNIVLPPLCSCGLTIWDTNPDTCANNCVFYKNPKAYAKALSTVLASSNLD
ncbi:trichohyalin-like [Stylophora pistillata]|uniref:trichohyalin-like n=1 Tax=Stylophora pistillata TaxID=50429 RepID=UPI000C04B0AE|nr:trichohyalin-like [Stylophora pistillata]